MPTVSDVLNAIETVAPARFAFSFDRIGFQVGDPSANVQRIATSLDPSHAAISFARERQAQLLLAHHPVVWDPITSLRYDQYKDSAIKSLIEGGVAFVSAHTNWDAAPGGINDTLASLIGLQNVKAVGSVSDKEQCKVAVTVPTDQAEAVVDAMSGAGAGVIGFYERCAFAVEGTGTFKPRDGANPTVGSVGAIQSVKESRIEMVCPADLLPSVTAAMLAVHPYEEPAYDVYPIKPIAGQPIARVGELPSPMGTKAFCDHLDKSLATRTLLCGPEKLIKTVAVCGGAAPDEWRAGDADAFVTGEVPHHIMVEAAECGKVIAASGHYATENPGAQRLGDVIAQLLGIEVVKFEPALGQSGRPL